MYKIIFRKDCKIEIREIHNYISMILKAKELADKLISKVLVRVSDLAEAPRLSMKIEKFNRYNGLKE